MGQRDKVCFVLAPIGPNGFQHLLLSVLIAMGCFYLVLTRPDVKEVWVIIGAVTQYWFTRANGHGKKGMSGNGQLKS
jgi:hypothetical protein